MDPSELRKHFLDAAAPIVDQYIAAALGTADLESYNQDCRKEVWDLVKRLMLQSTDKLDLPSIKGPEDVLKAVEQGKCTLEQAQMLVGMYNQVLHPKGGPQGAGGPLFTITINKNEEVIDANQQQVEGSSRGAGSMQVLDAPDESGSSEEFDPE